MSKSFRSGGFTLIEIIVGIVVLAIALVLITSIIVPTARQSVTPVYQMRAAELGQAMLNEILSMSFDQNSQRDGSRERCGKPDGSNPCTPENEFGPDAGETSRATFNDVDDYHDLDENPGQPYQGFSVAVEVCYSNAAGFCSGGTPTQFKRILATVTTPEGQAFEFSAIRGNF